MGGKKLQVMVLFGLLGVLALVAGYRLMGHGGTPAEADTGIVPQVSVKPDVAVADMLSPEDSPTWVLPTPEDLHAMLSDGWQRPRHDPFVMSPRVLMAAGRGPEPDLPSGEAVSQTPPPASHAPPTFAVRSTCSISGRWFAEIEGRLYGVGDVVRGFRITRIKSNALWASPSGYSSAGGMLEVASDGGKPSCVMRIGEARMALTNGRWLTAGETTDQGMVRSVNQQGVTYERAVGESGNPTTGDRDEFEVRVDPSARGGA